MTIRSILAATALVAGFTASAASQESHTFDAWGHTFTVPASRAAPASLAAPERHAIPMIAPKRAYVSTKVGTVVETQAPVPVTTTDVINVWGARITAPAR